MLALLALVPPSFCSRGRVEVRPVLVVVVVVPCAYVVVFAVVAVVAQVLRRVVGVGSRLGAERLKGAAAVAVAAA